MKKRILITVVKSVLISLLAIALQSCDSTNNKQHDIQIIPTDAPMSEFFVGVWVSEQAYDFEGRTSNYKYELEVVDENTLKLAVLSSNGDFLDGATSEYRFSETNTIFIDNKRVQGGELWLLERDGSNLIVHRTIANKTDVIIFTREVNN